MTLMDFVGLLIVYPTGLLIVYPACIKQYDSTVYVGIRAIVAPAAKNAASKTILKTFYTPKTTFTE